MNPLKSSNQWNVLHCHVKLQLTNCVHHGIQFNSFSSLSARCLSLSLCVYVQMYIYIYTLSTKSENEIIYNFSWSEMCLLLNLIWCSGNFTIKKCLKTKIYYVCINYSNLNHQYFAYLFSSNCTKKGKVLSMNWGEYLEMEWEKYVH